MKLSSATIQILQNFASINTSILLEEGNVLRTISESESIYAKAKVDDEFPKEVGIYDLPKMLGILSLSKESELNFEENFLEVVQGKSKVKYAYCSPDVIKIPPKGKDIVVKNPEVEFELKNEVLQNVLKAMGILRFSELAFTGRDGVLQVETLSTKNDNSDVYSTEIGETDKEFFAVFDAEKLKMIPGDYMVEISSKGISHFKGVETEYWIAINANKSTFG